MIKNDNIAQSSHSPKGGAGGGLKSLAKDTAIYGLSSIVGRFLNYLLVPLYTHYMPKESGDYGVSTNIYAYTALILVLLTFGMETTLFRFANEEKEKSDTVFSTGFTLIASLTAVFLILVFGFISPIADKLGYACFAEDAVHSPQYRAERTLFCGAA